MRLRNLLLLICTLLMLPMVAHAQAASKINLAWSYAQNPQRPATNFVVQRAVQVGGVCPATLTDLATIPVTQLAYLDAAVTLNITYCYAVLASDATGRSVPTPTATGGIFTLTAPGSLIITYQ